MVSLKTFCFPYAGGSKTVYADWISKYKNQTEIIPMEYKGHGSLYGEEMYHNLEDASIDLCDRLIEMNPDNYILYGHSMGSIIAVMTALQLEKKYDIMPKAVFISGMCPPHLWNEMEKIATLSKDEFLKRIFELGQTDPLIMNEPELMDILYEILLHDTKLYEEYEYKTNLPKLKVPLVVMTGDMDKEAQIDRMEQWKDDTDSGFYLKMFEGDHFFPFNRNEFSDYFIEMLKLAEAELL